MVLVGLKDSAVWRGGVTARQRTLETMEVKCGKNGNKVELYCEISSKGGGTTEVSIQIGSQDFAALTQAMCACDRYAAMITLSSELASEVAKQNKYDTAMIQEARQSVVNLAQNKVWDAPIGDGHVQELVLSGVKKLVEELSPKDNFKKKSAFRLQRMRPND